MNDYLPSILFIFGDITPITDPQYIPPNLIIPAYTNAPFLLILSEKGRVHNLFTHAVVVFPPPYIPQFLSLSPV